MHTHTYTYLHTHIHTYIHTHIHTHTHTYTHTYTHTHTHNTHTHTSPFPGDCPETLVAAGQYVHNDVTAVDLNCGCPQKIAKRGNYGAYLLPQTDLLITCLTALVKNLDCPVTVKIRVLPTEKETLDLVRRIEDTGACMII
jgi:tRNA-dihydrouridine synthase 1